MVGYLIFWGIVLIVMTLAELGTFQFVAVWFAAGSLVAFFLALADVDLWVQATVFILVSGLLLLFTRPIVTRLMTRPHVPTNADKVIGLTGVVLQTIDNTVSAGRVQADGLEWSARSDDDTVIPMGEQVLVKRIEGVKLIVEKTHIQ